MAQRPDYRARRVIEAAYADQDLESDEALERDLFHLVKMRTGSTRELRIAYELYADQENHHILDACLLGKVSPALLAESLDIPLIAIEIYQFLFFDVKVFDHHLARKRYVSAMACNDLIKDLYVVALDRGPSELLNRYRIGEKARIDAEAAMYTVLDDVFSKFLTHRGYAVTTETSREALKYGMLTLKAASMLLENSREDSRAASITEDLEIALKIHNHTKKLADINVNPDDLLRE